MKRAAGFAALTIGITILAAWVYSLMFTSAEEHRAIMISAAIAVVVQLAGFAIGTLTMTANPIAGWGIGVLMRLFTLVVYGLVAVRVMSLPPGAALISMATFLFLTTLVEPFFLPAMIPGKTSVKSGTIALSIFLLAFAQPARAQVERTDSAVSGSAELIQQSMPSAGQEAKQPGAADLIMPHITDSKHFEVPCLNTHLACEVPLPTWNVTVGGMTIDLAPTKHVLMMLLAATLCCVILISAARAQGRHQLEGKPPKGLANAMEALVLYMRNEVVLPNVGHHGERYVPFALTMFFFILFMNLLGLVPYGSTATGNISVTATLAIITFITVEIAGMRALGKGYLNTIFYWPHDMPIAMKIPLTLILTPVELIGKFTKPFALAIRLFANMTAGHVIVLALIGLIFTFPLVVFPAPLIMAIAIMLLELMVSFIQAFIFTLLTSVFIGLIRESAH